MAVKDHTGRRLPPISVAQTESYEADVNGRRPQQPGGRNFPYPAPRQGERGAPRPPRTAPGGSVGTTTSSPATPHGNG